MRPLLLCSALAALMSSPALAQDAPFCGGISLVGEWVGGDEAASDAVGAEAFFDLTAQVPIAGHMVHLFTLSQAGSVRIDVTAIPGGDPYIALYDFNGTEVGSDDDSGGDFASSMTVDLGEGTYCLASRSYESGVTDISVQIGRPEFFPESTAPAAAPPGPVSDGAGCGHPDVAIIADGAVSRDMLAGGTLVEATVAQNPAYAFDLTDEVPLTITAYSDLGDPLIRLKDASGSVLAENDDSDGLNSRIDMTAPLPVGSYCIEVDDLNGIENPVTVTLSEFDPVADRLMRLGQMELAPTTTDGVEVTDLGTFSTLISHDLMGTDRASWFTFTAPEGGLFVLEAIGTDVDPEIKLFDRAGREIAYSDDGPVGLDSMIVHRGQPGTYTLGARILDSGASGNIRLLLERYVPAQ